MRESWLPSPVVSQNGRRGAAGYAGGPLRAALVQVVPAVLLPIFVLNQLVN